MKINKKDLVAFLEREFKELVDGNINTHENDSVNDFIDSLFSEVNGASDLENLIHEEASRESSDNEDLISYMFKNSLSGDVSMFVREILGESNNQFTEPRDLVNVYESAGYRLLSNVGYSLKVELLNTYLIQEAISNLNSLSCLELEVNEDYVDNSDSLFKSFTDELTSIASTHENILNISGEDEELLNEFFNL